jgi:predicted Zn-dependent protease with MMP-like domain
VLPTASPGRRIGRPSAVATIVGPRYRGTMDERTRTDVDAVDFEVDFEAVDFDRVIDRALEDLPEAFLEQLGSVAIVVEDEATPDQLASVRAHGLFGLYQGVPRTRWGVDNVPIPSKITLFRGPLTRANPGRERLTKAIEDTLLHEIAHHFGIDDDRLRALQAERRAQHRPGRS